jgi:hypothetical protein
VIEMERSMNKKILDSCIHDYELGNLTISKGGRFQDCLERLIASYEKNDQLIITLKNSIEQNQKTLTHLKERERPTKKDKELTQYYIGRMNAEIDALSWLMERR